MADPSRALPPSQGTMRATATAMAAATAEPPAAIWAVRVLGVVFSGILEHPQGMVQRTPHALAKGSNVQLYVKGPRGWVRGSTAYCCEDIAAGDYYEITDHGAVVNAPKGSLTFEDGEFREASPELCKGRPRWNPYEAEKRIAEIRAKLADEAWERWLVEREGFLKMAHDDPTARAELIAAASPA